LLMKLAEILRKDGCQLVKLPDEFQLDGNTVSIRRQGDSLILEPIRSSEWPPGFFDRIHIDDPAFVRPPQGDLPPAPKMG
jgi:virulence-associated protein VagC